MKLKILIVTILILNINSLKGQHTIPEKKDNIILIKTKDNAEDNFKLFGKFLIDEGFSFTLKDLEFLTLTTSEKTSKGGYKYVLSISFKDYQIIIRPKCNYIVFGSTFENIQLDWTEWQYSGGTPYKLAFKSFEPILKKYNGELYYNKE
jgi:hypothetical protein